MMASTYDYPRLFGFAPVTAVLAFLALLVTFGWTLFDFRSNVEQWARRDLKTQAELAATSLEAPLRTQDFRRLQEFHQKLERKDMILRVRSPQGGWIFHGGYKGPTVEEYAPSGEYRVGVAISASQVYAPFYEALVGFVLATLVGIVGMFVVFFALYRQRVRIRELAKVEKFRSEFIADVSHEIKTPLTGILGAVEMLGDGEAKGEGEGEGRRAKVLADMIKKEAKRLQALVQEILDLARLEREGEKVNRVETDLAALVADVARRYGVQDRASAVREGADGTVGVGGMVGFVDPQLIEQALSNLVENAQRHSGSTDIAVSLVPSVAGGPIRLIVEDHGIGIPPEHLAQIFERFHRVDPARAAASGGAGLGLSIVRRIARLHGGDVRAENIVPHGARFTLILPVGKAFQD